LIHITKINCYNFSCLCESNHIKKGRNQMATLEELQARITRLDDIKQSDVIKV